MLLLTLPMGAHAALQALVAQYGPLSTKHLHYALGAVLPSKPAHADGSASPAASPTSGSTTSGQSAGALPASVDLSSYDPPVGNQGQVGSCAAWAVDYGLRGWYAERDGNYPSGGSGNTGGFEPMYTYAQLAKGSNTGTSLDANLTIQQTQGVDTRAEYSQGDFDYTDQPTTSEIASAAHYKIMSWTDIALGTGEQQAIETALNSGNPVGLVMSVYSNFYDATSSSYYVDVPTSGMAFDGYHGVFAVKYDANGLWIQNSWGTSWGLHGYAELSWAFVNGYVEQAVTMVPVGRPGAQRVATIMP